MRALIIGFGSIGRRHARNLLGLEPDCSLVIVRRDGIEDDETRDLGSRVVGSLDDGFRTHPDIAVVANPSALHAGTVLRALEAGIACYVEKPVITTRRDAHRIREVLRRTKPITTYSGCNLRLLPSLQEVRRILSDGELGTIVRADFQVGQSLPSWRPGADYRSGYSARRELGGGVVFDLVHELDAVRWLLGDGFEVRGAVQGRFSSFDIDVEDTACAVLGRPYGPPAVTVSMDYVHRGRMRRYTFVGEEGTLVWDFDEECVRCIKATGQEEIARMDGGFDTDSTYLRAMTEFIECAKRGSPTTQDLEEGMRSAELALAVKEASLQ